mmetsp:Transcript_76022/g.163166  ORF Transcript_76022/g.163166 Transcript_76022/m.163166 type:complete len:212 (-) Transcript_76022:892-1527(-)
MLTSDAESIMLTQANKGSGILVKWCCSRVRPVGHGSLVPHACTVRELKRHPLILGAHVIDRDAVIHEHPDKAVHEHFLVPVVLVDEARNVMGIKKVTEEVRIGVQVELPTEFRSHQSETGRDRLPDIPSIVLKLLPLFLLPVGVAHVHGHGPLVDDGHVEKTCERPRALVVPLVAGVVGHVVRDHGFTQDEDAGGLLIVPQEPLVYIGHGV